MTEVLQKQSIQPEKEHVSHSSVSDSCIITSDQRAARGTNLQLLLPDRTGNDVAVL